jgi:hypothetical protein
MTHPLSLHYAGQTDEFAKGKAMNIRVQCFDAQQSGQRLLLGWPDIPVNDRN